MSLRYKALALVLVLVTAVTGGLLLFVKWRIEDKTKGDIEEDIAVDGFRLRDKLHSVSDTARAALRASLPGSKVGSYKTLAGGIQANFVPIAAEWVTQSRADFSIAALDSIYAEENKAQALHKSKDWWIVASPDQRFASAPSVNSLVGRALSEVRTSVEVIPIGDSLFLAVAVPFFEDSSTFQQFFAFEDRVASLPPGIRELEFAKAKAEFPAIGVAMTLTELSNEWARKNRLRRPAMTGTAARPENEIYQVLFDQTRVTATSMPDEAPAREALKAARAAGAPSFRVPLEIGGKRETYIGLALNFDDREFSWDRPGFVTLKSFDRELITLNQLLNLVTLYGALLAILGALAAFGAAYLVIRRLRVLQAAAEKVRSGDFKVSVPVDSKDEVGALSIAFNNMIKGLQALGQYTDSVLARSVLDNPELLAGRAARHEGAILFTDIANFTGITESMDARELTAQLNEYFTAIGDHVKKEGGYVDKFIGDAVMAFWGPPFLDSRDYAVRACRTALQCMRAASDLRRAWQQAGRPLFFQRIGISTGEVVVGNIGSATKKNFTVIGDSVNLANRLEGASKIYGTEVLADERTVELAGNAILTREIDEITVRGKQKPVRVFEIMGLASETSTKAKRLIDGYGAALGKYRQNDFVGALAVLAESRKSFPDDGPSRWLFARCQEAMSGKVPLPTHLTQTYRPIKD